MSYLVEIEFQPIDLKLPYLKNLQLYYRYLSQDFFKIDGDEHESVTYPEGVYYEWVVNSIKIKIYWKDEEDSNDVLCISLTSFDEDVLPLGEQLKKYLSDISSKLLLSSFP